MIFRYPGAKTKLVHILYEHLAQYLEGGVYHDVFVGGGALLCHVAQKNPKLQCNANDKDPWISAFWEIISRGKPKEIQALLERVKEKPTLSLFKKLRATEPKTLVDKAYYAVFFNRTTFSGILNAGPIGGLNQPLKHDPKSGKYTIDCRYNASSMTEKILAMVELFRGRLKVHSSDAIEYVKKYPLGAMYLDPPYYIKGKELYRFAMDPVEHQNLSDLLRLRQNWVLSYDKCPEVEYLYNWAHKTDLSVRYSISGTNRASWIKKNEYILSANAVNALI